MKYHYSYRRFTHTLPTHCSTYPETKRKGYTVFVECGARESTFVSCYCTPAQHNRLGPISVPYKLCSIGLFFFYAHYFVSGKCHVVHSPNRAPQHHHPTGDF